MVAREQQGGEAHVGAELGEKPPLRHRAVYLGTGGARGFGERGKIDMSAEISGPGRGQYRNRAVFPHSAQGRTGAVGKIAVIDEQGGTRLACQPGAEPSPQSECRRAGLDDFVRPGGAAPFLREKQGRGGALRPVDKDEIFLGVERHHPLGPLRRPAHELTDRQGVQELVGNDQQWPRRQFLDRRDPDRIGPTEPPFLLGAKNRAALDQMEPQGMPKRRHRRGGAQQVRHQDTAARPQLGQDHRVRLPRLLPQRSEPQPDQLAKDLADLGCGDEIAAGADRIAPRVIAVVRVMERHRHKGGNRKGPLLADPARNPPGEPLRAHGRAGVGARRAQAIRTIPAISNGIDNSCPIVVPNIR